ncbi:phosphotransferase family protein [Legionella hackeliae]|uniref:Choline/ethanolamine kinase [F-box domain] n=1 Tax=Legionella hackeliae TaxID=449 RepID=A0A0A8UKH7_LEGHA|nr:phosphotransferase family protein [Legionella hackeliae]KTD12900.1 choline kinase [Legionella hackeliae]CEK09208.1 Choline/ethanolamine kinase [F-box domain] [Legionella hackeliae]STX49116.1 choline kinase [Legionella hackeliae]
MKISFFDSENSESTAKNRTPKIPERICLHILSFLNPNQLSKVSLVNTTWKALAEKTKHCMELMPAIKRIPLLKSYDLGQLGIYPMSGGMTNCTFKIRLRKKTKWVLRVPGDGATAFVDRKMEDNNARQASDLQINVTIDFFDKNDGLQLTRYLESKTVKEELQENPLILIAVAEVLKRLHTSALFPNTINLFTRNKQLLDLLKNTHPKILPNDFKAIEARMDEIEALIAHYKIPLSPCHNDATLSNFLVSQDPETLQKFVKMLDYEYSASGDLATDLAYFIWDGDLCPKHVELFVQSYFGYCDENLLAWFNLYKPVIGWWYTIWSWTQLANKANACDPTAYSQLATESYQKTKLYLETEEFKQAFNLIDCEIQSATFTGLRSF